MGDILDALDVEFGFSRVDFLPKGSKTQRIVVILAKTVFLLDALEVEFGFSRVDFPPKGSKTQSFFVILAILAKTLFFN